jgi:hypothetical protein
MLAYVIFGTLINQIFYFHFFILQAPPVTFGLFRHYSLRAPPVTFGLVGYYTAESYDVATNTWFDLSSAGNHVALTAATLAVTNKTSSSPAFLSGSTETQIMFPYVPPSPDSYTFFHVARYRPSGSSTQLIFQGCTLDFISGFYAGAVGVAWHKEWVTLQYSNISDFEWVTSSDRCTNYRANGIDRSLSSQIAARNGSLFQGDQLCVNMGPYSDGRLSAFDVQVVVQYNRTLSDAEVVQIELWLDHVRKRGLLQNLPLRRPMQGRKNNHLESPFSKYRNVGRRVILFGCPAGNYFKCHDTCICCAYWCCGGYNANCYVSPAGSYSPGGEDWGQVCSTRSYCPTTGMSAPLACPAGSFCNTTGLSSSFPCATGTYAPSTGLSACLACSAGTNSAPGMTACLTCSAGKFVNASAVACSTCPAGTYSATASQTACMACPDGTTTSSDATSCTTSGDIT